jgi:hypothetical protein
MHRKGREPVLQMHFVAALGWLALPLLVQGWRRGERAWNLAGCSRTRCTQKKVLSTAHPLRRTCRH